MATAFEGKTDLLTDELLVSGDTVTDEVTEEDVNSKEWMAQQLHMIADTVDVADLDLTNETVDLSGVDELLKQFQDNAMVKDALSQNVNLGEYSAKIEEDLKSVEAASIADYMDNAAELVRLHDSIGSCDSLLESMQHMLSGFQEHLKSISSDIKHLQDKSMAMNRELHNKKEAESTLRKCVSNLEITRELIDGITECDVSETEYERHLVTLNGKLEYVSKSTGVMDEFWCSTQDITPNLVILQSTAVNRLRGFLITEFSKLSVPKTNISLKQQQLLNKFKYYMVFISAHTPDLATELRTYYCEMMSKVYVGYFRTYVDELSKYNSAVLRKLDKHDMIGTNTAKTGGFFATKKSEADLQSLFVLGSRAENVLQNIGEDPIILQMLADATAISSAAPPSAVAARSAVSSASSKVHDSSSQSSILGLTMSSVTGKKELPFEIISRSYLRLLCDTVYSEYLFVLKFFNKRDLLSLIFEHTLALVKQQYVSYSLISYDLFGLLITLESINLFSKEMIDKKCDVLQSMFDSICLTLWPRLKNVLNENIASVKELEGSWTSSAGSSISTLSSTPHFATIRFSTCVRGIMQIAKGNDGSGQMLEEGIGRLREAWESLLLRISSHITGEKNALVYKIANYAVFVCALKSSGCVSEEDLHSAEQGSSFVDERKDARSGDSSALSALGMTGLRSVGLYTECSKTLDQLCKSYIESELFEQFGSWIQFIRHTEQKFHSNPSAKVDLSQMLEIARQFNESWQRGLGIAIDNVRTNFTPNLHATVVQTVGSVELFNVSKDILRQLLAQMMVYNSRFYEVHSQVSRIQASMPDIQRLLVSDSTLKQHIKSYWVSLD